MAKLHFRSYTTNQMVLFPQRIDENIAENDPVRIVSSIVDHLDMSSVNKLYNGMGRCPYHPRMMLKIIIYAYMNNIYSCRRIEQLLLRDIHFIWLAGYEKPDFITINRFRNRLKDEINNIFTQLVLVLAEKGFVSLDVEYVDGTKIESKANKYTFVWRKTVERNRARLIDKVKALLAQVDDCIAQDNTKTDETVEFTPSQLAEISAELNASLSDPQVEMDKEEKKKRRKLAKELKERSEKLAEYNQHLETLGDRNSYSKTDKDATFMHMKEDAINDGLTKPGYNLQIATENQFITNFALFPNPTDTLTYIPFMESFRERYGHFASTEVADSGYGSEENYEFMELNGTAAYVKYNRFHIEHRPQYVPDPFRSENFYYNKKEDYCVCPMGQHMTRTGTSHKTSASGYVSNRATYTAQNCEGCPLRCLCFDASGDRRVIDRNHKQEAYRQKASELLTSEEGLRHRGKRCIEPEAVFGQIKYNMAYRRFRHIGVDKVKMDFAFFAIAFNIKKMVAKMTKGGLFSYLRAYLTNITPYKLFIRLFFVEKQKLVVHPHKNVQRVFLFYIGSFDTPSSTDITKLEKSIIAMFGKEEEVIGKLSKLKDAIVVFADLIKIEHGKNEQRSRFLVDAVKQMRQENDVSSKALQDKLEVMNNSPQKKVVTHRFEPTSKCVLLFIGGLALSLVISIWGNLTQWREHQDWEEADLKYRALRMVLPPDDPNIRYLEKHFSVQRNDDVINNVRNRVDVYEDSIRRHHEMLEMAAYKGSIANKLLQESNGIKRILENRK